MSARSVFRNMVRGLVGLASLAVVATTSAAAQERAIDQLGQALEKAHTLRQQLLGYDAVFLRDPMRPLVDAQGDRLAAGWLSGSLSVQGIIWSDEQPLAVVDGELLPTGAVVGPYAIQQIHPDGIVVRRESKKTLFIPLDRGLEPPQERPMAQPEQQSPAAEPVPSS